MKMADDLLEQLADVEHQRWADWQRHVHSKCQVRADGLLIPAEFVARWRRQIETKYADLSEEEKESDRREVRRYLPLLGDIHA